MSTFDDASLVFIPSGYKTSKAYSVKPIDGSGDLTFTRSNDTATRVNSAGLIEKVRTNEVRNSTMVGASAPSTLPTNWTLITSGLTFTVIGTGTEGGFTYIEINATGTASSSNARIGFDSSTQILGATGQYWTNSFYFKKVSETAAPDAYAMAIFENTSAGSLVVANVGSLPATTSLARYSYTVLTAGGATVARVQPFVRFSLTSGNSYNFTFRIAATQMEQGDIATQFIPTTSAAVSVGPVANVPRLDYLNSSCPRLLLEPQRTNLLQFSEQFDNAYYSKNDSTITANDGISPDGFQSADKVTLTTTAGRVQRSVTLTADTQFTLSVFVKDINATNSRVGILCFNNANTLCSAQFTLTGNGSIFSQTNSVGSITPFGNGWYRCAITFNSQSGGTTPIVRVITNATGVGFTNGESVLIYGAQLETGYYASSYVNTLAASVTRGADSCSKTGISSLIGQTEGTLFVDMNLDGIDAIPTSGVETLLLVDDGTINNNIGIGIDTPSSNPKTLFGFVRIGGVFQALIYDSVIATNKRYKIALAYKDNDVALYINGQSIGTDTSVSIPTTSNARLTQRSDGTWPTKCRYLYNSTMIFKTRLPNSELAALTAL